MFTARHARPCGGASVVIADEFAFPGFAAFLDREQRDDEVNRRPVFTGTDGSKLIWDDEQREHVDSIILATGYRPDLPYLRDLGALDGMCLPLHDRGLSRHSGLGYVGLEWQRSLSSAKLRGVGRDAEFLVRRLRAAVRS